MGLPDLFAAQPFDDQVGQDDPYERGELPEIGDGPEIDGGIVDGDDKSGRGALSEDEFEDRSQGELDDEQDVLPDDKGYRDFAEPLPQPKRAPLVIPREGTMTVRKLARIVDAIGEIVQKRGNVLVFEVDRTLVTMAVDIRANRMRLMSPIVKTDQLTKAHLERLMQANFDTSLDARYAIAKGILWSTYIHPLSSLHKKQFISAIGQTVNAARNFGTTFSSGALSFGGGDSREYLGRETIDDLLKKGEEI